MVLGDLITVKSFRCWLHVENVAGLIMYFLSRMLKLEMKLLCRPLRLRSCLPGRTLETKEMLKSGQGSVQYVLKDLDALRQPDQRLLEQVDFYS